jgi:hypothetical protein
MSGVQSLFPALRPCCNGPYTSQHGGSPEQISSKNKNPAVLQWPLLYKMTFNNGILKIQILPKMYSWGSIKTNQW